MSYFRLSPILVAAVLYSVPVLPVAAQQPSRLGVSGQDASTQVQDERPSRKDPGTATLMSLLVIGGGQIYAGDTKRGLIMLGGSYGALIAGVALSSSGSCDFYTTFTCSESSYAPLYVGVLAYLGIGVYSILDASPTAKRMNIRNGYKVNTITPLLQSGANGTQQLGLRIAF